MKDMQACAQVHHMWAFHSKTSNKINAFTFCLYYPLIIIAKLMTQTDRTVIFSIHAVYTAQLVCLSVFKRIKKIKNHRHSKRKADCIYAPII